MLFFFNIACILWKLPQERGTYQGLVPQSCGRPLRWQRPERSSRWRTARRRSPCGRSSPRSCHTWRRWPRRPPWWLAACSGCRWRPASSASVGPSCWWRCWPSGWRRRVNVWRGAKTTQTPGFRGKLTSISSPNDWGKILDSVSAVVTVWIRERDDGGRLVGKLKTLNKSS